MSLLDAPLGHARILIPVVTVVMPARNCAATVGAAVRSVLGQTLPALELRVIDDGSTDDTVAAVRAAAGGDERLRLQRQAPLGIVAALNAGLEGIRTPFVARMDADDLAHPDRLGEQVAALERDPRLSVVSSRVQLEPADSGMKRYVDWLNGLRSPEQIAAAMYVESPVCHPSVAWRAPVVRDAGGYRDPGWPEDYDLWLRLHQSGARFEQVPKTLLVWRDTPDRLTRTHPRYAREQFFRIKAHFLARVLPGRARIWGAGRTGLRLARALEAEGVRITTFVDVDPAKIGGKKRGEIPIIGPHQLERGDPVIPAVGVAGARDQIRRRLIERGFREGDDFICAA